MTGKVAAVEAASCKPQLMSVWLRTEAMPTAIVKFSVDLRQVSGPIRSFQAKRKVKMPNQKFRPGKRSRAKP